MISDEKKKDLIKHKAEIQIGISGFKFKRIIYLASVIVYAFAAILINFKEAQLFFVVASCAYGILYILNNERLKDFEYALKVIEQWEKES